MDFGTTLVHYNTEAGPFPVIGKPTKATKAALLLSCVSPNAYEGAIASYKALVGYLGLEDAGIITAVGEENESEAKLMEIRALAKAL